ncbi:hypothetical protein F5Y13DRAFT_25881 [Hypoxylon sp. FL1857]|nr:hypothetical protein F5Y13DRAFT_25881 [Hypoxylon sp. FL1857]
MPGEEMEITTDFGHGGFGEDIDIDLDFAVGQPDEDLELADFDQAQEIQNFNSDTRDELMAEGDDASYGMIDADDIDHNEAATTANDIEIDLGDPDENLWQHDASHEDTFQNIAELEYVETTDVANNNTENVAGAEGSWLETSVHPVNKPSEVGLPQVDTSAIDAANDNLPQDSTAPPDGIHTQDFGVSEASGDGTALDIGNENNGLETTVQNVLNEQQDVTLSTSQRPTEEFGSSEQGPHEDPDDNQPDGGDSQSNITHEVHEVVPFQTGDKETSDAGHGEDNALDHEEKSSIFASLNHGSVEEHNIDEHADHQDPSEHDISEHPIGGDSYVEPTNDQGSVDQALKEERPESHDPDEARSQPEAHDPESEDHEEADTNQEGQISQANAAHVEHPLSIATRHEMFISYGQTDYRLFAKSEDDDPNHYFLRDMSALEFPLGQFLLSLREVIADEVSPLDELVMHVDGLGLEFSESSTSDMLDQFTFGDILGLYDKLVKNDGAELAPCLYTYLMVRPNCHQRLMALLDSANSGRGLSEIAVYREATPDHDDQTGAADHSPYASPHDAEGDEAEHLPSPQAEDEGGDEAYEDEHEHGSGTGDDADEYDNGENEDRNGPNSPSVHTSVAEANAEDSAGQAEAFEDNAEEDKEENPGTNVDGNAADGEIDYSDDELDLSSLKQGKSPPSFVSSLSHCNQRSDCRCDTCFDLELERDLERIDAIWGLGSSASTLSGTTVATSPVHYSSQGQSSALWTRASLTQQRPALPELRPFQDLRIITNPHPSKDHQADTFPQDNTHIAQKESNGLTTNEHSDSNPHTPPTNGSADVPNSDATSVTATLTGDDKDEIDYSDDDGEDVVGDKDTPSNSGSGAPTALKVPIDDEITWESENEDAKNELTTAPKQTVQVSPTSGKRPRSDSDLPEGATEQHDVKRRRPS